MKRKVRTPRKAYAFVIHLKGVGLMLHDNHAHLCDACCGPVERSAWKLGFNRAFESHTPNLFPHAYGYHRRKTPRSSGLNPPARSPRDERTEMYDSESNHVLPLLKAPLMTLGHQLETPENTSSPVPATALRARSQICRSFKTRPGCRTTHFDQLREEN